jgi:hypothetical protein
LKPRKSDHRRKRNPRDANDDGDSMASKKRGLGTANTEAPPKNAPLKSNFYNNQARRRTQRKNPRGPGETRAGASTRRSYAVYYGQRLLGHFIVNEATNQALAWNASRQFLGRFDGYKAASRAINRAAVTERQRAEARRRLDDPNPPFASGLPEHFRGRR